MRVLSGGSLAFDAILYPENHSNNNDYFESAINRSSDLIYGIGKKVFDVAKRTYDYLNSNYASQIARRALDMADGLMRPDTIYCLRDLEDMQTTQGVMRRWLMAMPEIGELYNKHRCNGWDNTYIDPYAGQTGLHNPDYRMVMSGLVKEIEDDKEYRWSVHEYIEDDIYDRHVPNQLERISIRNTWDIARAFIDAGNDPTNCFGGTL